MTQRNLLGMLTPSSNTIVEPVVSEMLRSVSNTTAHFSRFEVTQISLDRDALDQFQSDRLVAAATLLSHARVASICWAGTSAGWLGPETDHRLCRQIEEATGIAATTSTLALLDAFTSAGVKNYGLVTPYLDDIQEKIIGNFRQQGFNCVRERHLCDRGNFSFSEYGEDIIEDMVREVAADKPDAIAIFCTNLRGASLADRLEKDLGIPVYDSNATSLWGGMRAAGLDPSSVQGWGSLFALKTPHGTSASG
uniref:maleate cis-trans isomerase family protein n=1 Tax=Pararhizobium sp. IMCC3301 TaxID=3067904 RepID=UPI002740DD8D|nr:aspartate/glutamate racemase family protein [Pararhizobium sp. IMCC3301]